MIVWLASYPRSGNTFFRVILNSAFGIKTYSLYDDLGDIGADEATTDIVGHTFLPKDFDPDKARASDEIYYIKTHELLNNTALDDSDKVIYLVRDGRECILSFTKHRQIFYKKDVDYLENIVYGHRYYGTWGEHIRQWKNRDKLLIKFEMMTDEPSSILQDIANYLNIQPISNRIPTFQELQKINPKFFRSGKKDSWKKHFSESDHLAFWLQNANEMIKMGYTDDMPKETNDTSFQKYASLFQKQNSILKASRFSEGKTARKLKAKEEENRKLTELISSIYQSKSYKLGKAIAEPYRNLKNILK